MCVKVVCATCGKVTWKGCGQHVQDVMKDVKPEDRCNCPRNLIECCKMPRNRSPGFRDSYSPMNYSKNSYEYDRHQRNSHRSKDRIIRSLCIGNIHSKIPDSYLNSYIEKEFAIFGEYNLSITSFNGERVAYVNFKNSEAAAEAFQCLQNLEIESRSLSITPVFVQNKRYSPQHQYRRSRSPRFSRLNRRISHHESSSEMSDKRSRSNSPRFNYREKSQYETLPTRTLFLGNLSYDVDEEILRRKFEKYGEISDIDIKRQALGRQGNTYAFIKYATLDMASRAKHELDGQYIGGSQIKIGYGKPLPSTCVWIGGLGPWVVFEDLEREIIRFGNVKRIEWPRNKNYAYAIYDTINDASSAVDNLRNISLGGEHRRLRVDFSDINYFNYDCKLERYHRKPRVSASRHHSSPQSKSKVSIETAKSTAHLSECLRGIWTGKIILKNKNFGCRFYKFKGDETLVTDFMFEEKHNSFQPISLPLRITQRMPIDLDKLKEIKQRIDTLRSREYCIMFATSFVVNTTLMDDALHPHKPIQNLIEYLRSKNSAGVVFLKSNTELSKGTLALHIFPPCDFVFDLLHYKAPNLVPKYMMDDFVLILLMQNVVV